MLLIRWNSLRARPAKHARKDRQARAWEFAMADNRLGPTSAGAGTSHLGTITADLLEEERAGFIYNNDQEMLEANAVLEAEAEDREKLETLQHQLKTKRSRMKMLQECIAPTRPPPPIPALTTEATLSSG